MVVRMVGKMVEVVDIVGKEVDVVVAVAEEEEGALGIHKLLLLVQSSVC